MKRTKFTEKQTSAHTNLFGRQISATRRRREDYVREMWRWQRGVVECISVWKEEIDTKKWKVWQLLGNWEGPYTKLMMAVRLCGGTSCA